MEQQPDLPAWLKIEHPRLNKKFILTGQAVAATPSKAHPVPLETVAKIPGPEEAPPPGSTDPEFIKIKLENQSHNLNDLPAISTKGIEEHAPIEEPNTKAHVAALERDFKVTPSPTGRIDLAPEVKTWHNNQVLKTVGSAKTTE